MTDTPENSLPRTAVRQFARVLLCLCMTAMYHVHGRAQEVDTLKILQVLSSESEIDSLRLLIRNLEANLETLKASLLEGADIQELLASLSEEEEDDVPEDQRSKRKRVDALLKAMTARPGQLRFNGGATTVIHWASGGGSKFTTATGSFDIFAHTSLSDETLVFLDIEAVGGIGPDGRIPNNSVLNGDAGSTQDADGTDRLTVLEAWTEISVFDEAVTGTVGKIDITNYFDNNGIANDETSQFITGAFVNSATLPAYGPAPGIRVRSSVLDKFFFQFALVRTINSGDNIFSSIIKAGSVGLKLFPESGVKGNLRMYAYVLPAPGHDGGAGISYDQALGAGISFFGRVGRNRAGSGSMIGIREAWSAGGRYVTTVSGNRFVAAMAYGQLSVSSAGLPREHVAECYARIQLNKWSFVSPHVQWIDPAGAGPTHILLSVRTQFNF